MEAVKQLAIYLVLFAVLWVSVVALKKYTSRIQVPVDYTEIAVPDVDQYRSYPMSEVTIAQLSLGDVVCYGVPHQMGGAEFGFGWVAGLPGDSIAFSGGKLLVNGQPDVRSQDLVHADSPPVLVPAEHLFVVTTVHRTDSVVNGMMSGGIIRGRVENFP